jgi:ADP-ribosylglycohydrolase
MRNGQPVERAAWPAHLDQYDVVMVSQAADLHPAGNLACVRPARFRPVASIAYRLALVAAGDGAAAVSLNGPCAWDYGAGHALLRAVGGVLLNEAGREVGYEAAGWSSTAVCFGGAPAIAAALATRDWRSAPVSGFGPAEPPLDMRPARLKAGTLFHDTDVLRRAQGCLLGQLAGDALGSLVEFERPEWIARRFPDGPRRLVDGGTWDTLAGQPTDDSELALMLARSLLARGGFDREAVASAYATWYHGWDGNLESGRERWRRPFDLGSTTRQALSGITAELVRTGRGADAAEAAASRASQANGALMRASPLGIWGWNREPAEVAEAARADARLTHPHPVCQDASAVFVVAIAHAIRAGGEPSAVYDHALSWARANGGDAAVVAALEGAASEAPADFTHQQGWVLLALQNAFYRLLHAESVEAAVVETVRQGGDTDTNAAICGALLGAVYGRRAVPDHWQRLVLTCRPMPGYDHIRKPRPAQFWPADAMVLAERLLSGPSAGLFLKLPRR